ncbi:hypothetical protein NYZ99_15290 [Maribacter litopenaei]|uniref:Uncharacterized protein n=1 Tax=Maribacter litopenaei TaxID=2976127 RepID=A0ABY5Y7G5_9FLAO|nr:hypothetical protein [Maribacter litopenaei]UWX54302.1 hypothetical protein NYZ99_15290 [Maribacter litopenaei]
MNVLPPYAEHIDYYKDCIAHINSVIDFPGYLQRNGYQLIAKSAGSMEFKKDDERLGVEHPKKSHELFQPS